MPSSQKKKRLKKDRGKRCYSSFVHLSSAFILPISHTHRNIQQGSLPICNIGGEMLSLFHFLFKRGNIQLGTGQILLSFPSNPFFSFTSHFLPPFTHSLSLSYTFYPYSSTTPSPYTSKPTTTTTTIHSSDLERAHPRTEHIKDIVRTTPYLTASPSFCLPCTFSMHIDCFLSDTFLSVTNGQKPAPTHTS